MCSEIPLSVDGRTAIGAISWGMAGSLLREGEMCIMFYNETVVSSPCQRIPPTTRSSKAVAESALVHRPTRPVRRRGGRPAVLRRASPVCGRRWRPHEADAIDPWAAPSRARSRAVAGHGRSSRGGSCPRAHSRARAGRSSRPGIHRWPPRPAGGPALGATTGGPGAPDAAGATTSMPLCVSAGPRSLTSRSVAQQKNRNWCLAQHALAQPGGECAREPAARARRHRDEIGAESIGLEQNLLSGLAEADHAFHGNALELGGRTHQLLEALRRESLHLLIDVGDGAAVAPHHEFRNRYYPQQPHDRALIACQSAHDRHRRMALGLSNRYENAFSHRALEMQRELAGMQRPRGRGA